MDGLRRRGRTAVARRCNAFGQDLPRTVAAAAAASADTEGLGELVERGHAQLDGAMDLAIGYLVADADVHKASLGQRGHRHVQLLKAA